MIGYIIIGIIVLLFLYVFVTYNSIISIRNKVDEAFSTMDVYLKKRWDLIPSIVETVKGYSKHETDTLVKSIEARNARGGYDKCSNEEKINENNGISNEVVKFMALAESYPDLKANANYLELMETLKSVENDIANSRKYYNAVVRDYEIKIQSFPNNIIAGLFGFKEVNMFEASDEECKGEKLI